MFQVIFFYLYFFSLGWLLAISIVSRAVYIGIAAVQRNSFIGTRIIGLHWQISDDFHRPRYATRELLGLRFKNNVKMRILKNNTIRSLVNIQSVEKSQMQHFKCYINSSFWLSYFMSRVSILNPIQAHFVVIRLLILLDDRNM